MSSFALLAFIFATAMCGGLVRLLATYQDYMDVNKVPGFHPLMQPLIMFLSSSLCLTVYIIKNKNPRFLVRRKKFKWRYLLIPAVLFLINVFQNVIAIRYLYNGLYTIMKSISIISCIIMEKCFYPHRSYTKNQYMGLSLTVVGQAAIGVYSLIITSDVDIVDINNDIEINIILGITLLLISIFPMAFYYLLQERFMKAFRLDPLQYVGTQGAINSLTTIVLILAFQWLPCSNKTCQFEINNNFYLERVDVWWDQLVSNNIFLYTTIVLLIFFAFQMYLEFFIMKAYSGVACNVISTLYMMVPYFYGLIVAHWFPINFVLLGGFLIIIIGVLIFYHIPNFSQINDIDSQTSSSVAVPEYNQEGRIRRSSLEDQLNPTAAAQDQRSSEHSNQNKEDFEQSGGSSSSKKRRAPKQHLITYPQSIQQNKRQDYDSQNQYIPPRQQNFNEIGNSQVQQMEISTYVQNPNRQFNNNFSQNNYPNNHSPQRQQKLRTAINNFNYPNGIVYLDSQYQKPNQQQYVNSQQYYQGGQNKFIAQMKNINGYDNQNNNDPQTPSSYFEGRLSPSQNQQQQTILKSQNSQSNNDDDDSSVYYNNKFLRGARSKDNSKSNCTQGNNNIDTSFNELLNNFQLNQQQGKEQQPLSEQNDINSIISNNQKINRYSGSGLWISHPNQRNKSNLYDQSILLLGSHISDQNQSSIFYKDTTPKQIRAVSTNNLTLDPTYEYEDENKRSNSSYIQRDFEFYVEGKNSNIQQMINQQNNQILPPQSQQDLSPNSSQHHYPEEGRKKSNQSAISFSGKKSKGDKKILAIANNFQEDMILEQANEDRLIQIQKQNDSKDEYYKRNHSKQLNFENQEDLLFENDESKNEILQLNNMQPSHNSIPSPSVSPIHHKKNKEKKKNRKLLILNI